MIDIHSHILPEMDDGSASCEESSALLSLLRQQGISTVSATAHFYANRETPAQFLQRREEAFARLSPAQDSLPRILLGAEVAYFSGIGSCEELIGLQIGQSGLLLVEMPFRPWTDRIIADVCAIPTQLGLTPVLAHVDRYRAKGQFSKYYRQLLDNDVLFQCNADVFETGSGRRWALRQLKQGNIHFLGSDCHNLTSRPPKLQLATNSIIKKLGPEALEQLNARARQLLFP